MTSWIIISAVLVQAIFVCSADNPWSSWSKCSKGCGLGIKVRTKSCGTKCTSFLQTACKIRECVSTGPSWTSWSKCSTTCGLGIEIRRRSCGKRCTSFSQRACLIRNCGTNNALQKRGRRRRKRRRGPSKKAQSRPYNCKFIIGTGIGESKFKIGKQRGGRCVAACVRRKKTDSTINGATIHFNRRRKGCWCVRNMKSINSQQTRFKTCFIKFKVTTTPKPTNPVIVTTTPKPTNPVIVTTTPKPKKTVIDKPAPKPASKMSQSQIDRCVASTNDYRGKQKDTQGLLWDDGLASIAQAWANHLLDLYKDETVWWKVKLKHSANSGYGENLFWGVCTLAKKCENANRRWYSEIKFYNYTTHKTINPWVVSGHFTQLVWKSTTKFGIGIAYGPFKEAEDRTQTFIVANYAPPGNVVGKYSQNVMPLK